MSDAELRRRLKASFVWRGERWARHRYADVTGWWRDADLIQELGPALARLVADAQPTVVLGLESRGTLLGGLVAAALGVGLIEVRKEPEPFTDSDRWLTATTPPDYRDRHMVLSLRADLLTPDDRVVLVDDWIDTGGQALGAYALVQQARASWLGVAVVADALNDNRVRRQLQVRSLLHERDL